MSKGFEFTVPKDDVERAGFAATMDMLRYDSAIVLSNAPGGFYRLWSENYPTVARWNSFGIAVFDADGRNGMERR